MELTIYHKKRYGAYGGNPNGYPADPARCAETVSGSWFADRSQCSRKRGHGPEGAFCKQHDPEAKLARKHASRQNDLRRYRKEAMWKAGALYRALSEIADGHNDPRALAKDAIAKFDEQFPKPEDA